MPFDFRVPQSGPELSTVIQARVRAALAGWRPRPIDPPAGWRPLAALRSALSLRRRPLPDKNGSLC
jgi:hypothetical protein